MADLSNVEKILVDKHGFTDNGDGTVTHPNGSLYDTERGGYYTPEPAERVVTSQNATATDLQNIKELADLKYLAQNTGVATSVLNQAYAKLGIDPSDNMAFTKAEDLLREYGYNPGSNTDYYGNNQANDVGAQLLYQRWQDAPTEEELEEATQFSKEQKPVNDASGDHTASPKFPKKESFGTSEKELFGSDGGEGSKAGGAKDNPASDNIGEEPKAHPAPKVSADKSESPIAGKVK